MNRCMLTVRITLLSDTLFGSGNSIPGGEDIAACTDEKGYPWLKGTTFKGLLRESFENLLVWENGTEEDLTAVFGASDWNGKDEERRLQVTAFYPEKLPPDPDECFSLRTFTKLEDGIIASGTLRTANCIRKGMTFVGILFCGDGDCEHICSAVSGIRWGGMMRSRGLGLLRCEVTDRSVIKETPVSVIKEASVLRYTLRTELPVIVTDRSRSTNNSLETCPCIPGETVRGMVIGTLARQNAAFFGTHRRELLSASVRFTDALPVLGEGVSIPSVRGFYESKDDSDGLRQVLLDPDIPAGWKRAGLGSFCMPRASCGQNASVQNASGTILYGKAGTENVLRIARGHDEEAARPFRSAALSAGQEFTGYIFLDDPSFSEAVSGMLCETVWLGADRFEGFGRCTVTDVRPVGQPAWIDEYGYREDELPGKTLFLLALSPLCMTDRNGEPCGIDCGALAALLGVQTVSLEACDASLCSRDSYNRTWGCRDSSVMMYERGSLFRLSCEPAPLPERLRSVEINGLGIRRAEGFGTVLFLPPRLIASLHAKKELSPGRQTSEQQSAAFRRAKYQWVMNNAGNLTDRSTRLSRSQLGSLQAAVESGGKEALDAYFQNVDTRGVQTRNRYENVKKLCDKVFSDPLDRLLGAALPPNASEAAERIVLLSLLFNYCRKNGGQRT